MSEVAAAVEQGLVSVVNDLALHGPETDYPGDIECHSLSFDDIVLAWSRGYRLKFPEVFYWYDNPALLLAALKRGMPLTEIRCTGHVKDEHLRLCTSLKKLCITDPSITFVPPTVECLEVQDPSVITRHVMMACTNLRELRISRGVVDCYPPSLRSLKISGAYHCLSNYLLQECPDLEELEFEKGSVDLSGMKSLRKLTIRGTATVRSYPEGLEELSAEGPDVTIPKGLKTLKLRDAKDLDLEHYEGLRELVVYDCVFANKRLPASLERLTVGKNVDVDMTLCTGLKYLDARCNATLKECPETVEELDACDSCGITDVSKCLALKKLNVSYNSKIRVCPPNVEVLVAIGDVPIDISGCHSLKSLDASGNMSIKSIPPGLETLTLIFNSGITQEVLMQCDSLKTLSLNNNRHITDFPKTVRRLEAAGTSGIGDAALEDAELDYLHVAGNEHVTKVPKRARKIAADANSQMAKACRLATYPVEFIDAFGTYFD